MKAANACSGSSEDESARAQRLVASRMSERRPSSSRSASASRAPPLAELELSAEPLHQPPDEETDDQADADGEGDVVDVVRRVELIGAQLFERGVHRRQRKRQDDPAPKPVANCRLGDRDHERLPDRRPELERVDEHKCADNRRVEQEAGESDHRERAAGQRPANQPEEADGADAQDRSRHPGGELVAPDSEIRRGGGRPE